MQPHSTTWTVKASMCTQQPKPSGTKLLNLNVQHTLSSCATLPAYCLVSCTSNPTHQSTSLVTITAHSTHRSYLHTAPQDAAQTLHLLCTISLSSTSIQQKIAAAASLWLRVICSPDHTPERTELLSEGESPSQQMSQYIAGASREGLTCDPTSSHPESVQFLKILVPMPRNLHSS